MQIIPKAIKKLITTNNSVNGNKNEGSVLLMDF